MENPNNSLDTLASDKGNDNSNQLKTIFQFLFENVATASMVAEETGVPQKNICRYKRDLENLGRLWEIEKKPCEKTGFKAWYLTTNPDLAPTYLLKVTNCNAFKGIATIAFVPKETSKLRS